MFNDIFGIVGVAAPYIMRAEVDGSKGPEKKAQVIAAIEAEIAKPGGLEYPTWLPAMVRPVVLSACIELAVFLFNRAGGADIVKKFMS